MKSLDKPRYLIVAIVLVGIAYAGYSFYQHSQSQDPDWQVNKMSEGSFPPHRVNLWSYPYPPSTGETTFAVAFDFINLMNDKVDRVTLTFRGPGSQPVLEKTATYSEQGRYEGRYRAAVELPRAGTWEVTVKGAWEDRRSESQFEIQVE